MDLGIEDRVALVSGAAGGLGSAVATTLAAEGVRVAACDLNGKSLEAFVEKANNNDGVIHPFCFDLRDLDAVDTAMDAVESALGRVDILVNITGGPPPASATGIPTADWRSQFDAMVLPVLHLTSRVLPAMCEAGWGRVVTSTSSGVVTPIPNLALSNALRSTLVGWSKSLSSEVAGNGVTMNVVVPGRIATRRVQQLDELRAEREGVPVEEVSRTSASNIPVGRYGSPSEYADVVAFLCSERASFVTGSLVRVDGGMIPSI